MHKHWRLCVHICLFLSNAHAFKILKQFTQGFLAPVGIADQDIPLAGWDSENVLEASSPLEFPCLNLQTRFCYLNTVKPFLCGG